MNAPHPAALGFAWEKPSMVKVLGEEALTGYRAIVTGAGSGIGQAIAVRLVELGARVTGFGRNPDRLNATAGQCAQLAGSFDFTAVDVRDADQTRAAVAEATADGLDLLVNNAGGQFYAPAEEISDRGFRSVVDLNLNAVFSIISAARPALAVRGGAIVNISLSGVDRGSVGAAHSIAARAGVLAMTRTLALEWAHLGIRVNCVGPGIVLSADLPPAVMEYLSKELVPNAVPAGRATPAEDVAELIAFLATPAARMITGQLLQIDGAASLGRGLHMLPNWPPRREVPQ